MSWFITYATVLLFALSGSAVAGTGPNDAPAAAVTENTAGAAPAKSVAKRVVFVKSAATLRAEKRAKARKVARALAKKEAIKQARAEAKAKAEARAKAKRVAARKAKRKAARIAAALLRNPPVQAPFTIATFNALGDSHTRPGGNKDNRGWAQSDARTGMALQLFAKHGVDVVGLQEFESPQSAALMRRAGGTYGWHGTGANSVAWRKSVFEFVSASTVTVPYFGGRPTAMPVVRLRMLATGQEMEFISVHNPADVRGAAGKWRTIATAKELAHVQALRAVETPAPIFMLGDMNARADFFCQFAATGDMHAASGGTHTPETGCVPSAYKGIDWIFGSTGVTFSGFTVDWSNLVRKATDHPLVTARVG